MNLKVWFGWESLLAISMFGGVLRVLPVSGIYIWSGVFLSFVFAMFYMLFIEEKRAYGAPSHGIGFVIGFYGLIIWSAITLVWSPISVSQLVVGDYYIFLNAIAPTIALSISNSSSINLEKRWITGVILAIFSVSAYCAYLWITSSYTLYEALSVLASEDAALDGVYLGVGQALMASSIVSFTGGLYFREWRKIAIVVSAICFWMAIESGARGPVTWGLLALILFFMIRFVKRPASLEKGGIAVLIAIIGLDIIFIIDLNFEYLSTNSPLFIRFNSDAERGYDELSSLGMRFIYYERALLMFLDNPIIGHGALSFRSLSEIDIIYPHNLLLDAMSDLGLVGLVTTVYLLSKGLMARLNILADNARPFKIICAILFVYFLGMEMSSGYLYWSWIWPWSFLLVKLQAEVSRSHMQQLMVPTKDL